MGLLQLVLLLLYAVCLASSLPITSTPLETNPDNLAWDAILTVDTRYPSEHEEARKIPKSIFITPNFNESQTNCRPGHRLGSDGKCYKATNFNIDPIEILKNQFDSVLSPTVDYDEDYDYYGYDSGDTTNNGPYHVPLSVSFGDTPQKNPLNEKSADTTHANKMTETKDNKKDQIHDATQPVVVISSTVPISRTTISNSKIGGTTESIKATAPQGPITVDGITPIISLPTPTMDLFAHKNQAVTTPTAITDDQVPINQKPQQQTIFVIQSAETVTEVPAHNGDDDDDDDADSASAGYVVTSTMENAANTITTMASIIDDDAFVLVVSNAGTSSSSMPITTVVDDGAAPQSMLYDGNNRDNIELIKDKDDGKKIQIELQSESLFEDGNQSNRTTISGADDGLTTEQMDDITTIPIIVEDTMAIDKNEMAHSVSQTVHNIEQNNEPMIVVATTKRVHIVTPTADTTDNQAKLPDDQVIIVAPEPIVVPATATSTTVPVRNNFGEIPTAILNVNPETEMNKRMRETVIKHELNEDAIDTIDQHNRFVYNHLGQQQQQPPPKPQQQQQQQPPYYHHLHHGFTESTTKPATTPPPVTTPRSFLEQLRLINKFTEENRRLQRIKATAEPTPFNIFSNYKGGAIKFPGPVAPQRTVPTFNRLTPDQLPKRPSIDRMHNEDAADDATITTTLPPPVTTSSLFSWLPSGWTFDRSNSGISTATNARPVLMRFWNKMPLIRDPSLSFGSSDRVDGSTDRARENSKSPTDSLYKEVPAADVYKVLTAKNSKYINR